VLSATAPCCCIEICNYSDPGGFAEKYAANACIFGDTLIVMNKRIVLTEKELDDILKK
jgi:hypothetical protein